MSSSAVLRPNPQRVEVLSRHTVVFTLFKWMDTWRRTTNCISGANITWINHVHLSLVGIGRSDFVSSNVQIITWTTFDRKKPNKKVPCSIDVLFPLVGWLIEGFLYPFNDRWLMTDGIPNQPLYFYQKDIIGSSLSHNIFMVRYSHALPSKK